MTSGTRNIHSPTHLMFSLSLTPLIQMSFSSQPSASIKIKGDCHNFCKENTKHLLDKITPALQANYFVGHSIILVNHSVKRFVEMICLVPKPHQNIVAITLHEAMFIRKPEKACISGLFQSLILQSACPDFTPCHVNKYCLLLRVYAYCPLHSLPLNYSKILARCIQGIYCLYGSVLLQKVR